MASRLSRSHFVCDDDFVLVETLTGAQRLDDPEEVGVYVKAGAHFEAPRDTAATGSGAVALIQRVVAALRG